MDPDLDQEADRGQGQDHGCLLPLIGRNTQIDVAEAKVEAGVEVDLRLKNETGVGTRRRTGTGARIRGAGTRAGIGAETGTDPDPPFVTKADIKIIITATTITSLPSAALAHAPDLGQDHDATITEANVHGARDQGRQIGQAIRTALILIQIMTVSAGSMAAKRRRSASTRRGTRRRARRRRAAMLQRNTGLMVF